MRSYPYSVVDFLLEDLETGKARKDDDLYRRNREAAKKTTVGELVEALKKFNPNACVCVYDNLGALVDPLELVEVGNGIIVLPFSYVDYGEPPF